jgi:hypothetical protein
LGREADHSPPFCTEVKEWVELVSTPQCTFMAWCSVRGSTGSTLPLHLPLVSTKNLCAHSSISPGQALIFVLCLIVLLYEYTGLVNIVLRTCLVHIG